MGLEIEIKCMDEDRGIDEGKDMGEEMGEGKDMIMGKKMKDMVVVKDIIAEVMVRVMEGEDMET